MGAVATLEKFFGPLTPQQREPEPPEFTMASAGAKLKAAVAVHDELNQLKSDARAADEALEAARSAHQLEHSRIRQRERELRVAEDESRRATNFVLARSERSAQEIEFHDKGIALQRKGAELRRRYSLFAVVIPPVEESTDGKRLAEVQEQITECEAAITRLNSSKTGAYRHDGLSAPEFKLHKLLIERGGLAPRVEAHKQKHAQFLEIQANQREMEECFAKREQLRVERESECIARAIKAAK